MPATVQSAVIDTCVIVDMFLNDRPRHAKALVLRREMRRLGIRARVPAFALFEVAHAIRQQRRLSTGQLVEEGEENGVALDPVAVDEQFFERYFDLSIPEMRAGDLVFASLAKKEGLPLVTEDRPFFEQAKLGGITVFDIDGYIAHLAIAV
jgi:predicted nucleic acid-binding protein